MKIIAPEHHAGLRRRLSRPGNPSESTDEPGGVRGDRLILRADAAIIGSGAGGAVAARELSRAGFDVVVIEEGSFFQPAEFTPDELRAYTLMYRDGGLTATEDGSLRILQGRTLGGSTTVNWQTCLYPHDLTTAEWETRFGLTGYDQPSMADCLDEVRARIGAKPVKHRLINENNEVLLRGARRLGLSSEILSNNNDHRCVGFGRCGQGCPIDAKQAAYLNWLPDAAAAGARILTNFRALHIEDGPVKTVTAAFAPHPERESPEDYFTALELKAPLVIVSAGALESPALLQRSGLGNAWVGRNLKVHPTLAVFAEFDRTIAMYHGPPQSVVVDDTKLSGHGYGYWLEPGPFRPPTVAASLPYIGRVRLETLLKYGRLQAGIVHVKDGADGETAGSVRWEEGRRKIEYRLSPGDTRSLLAGVRTLARIQAAAGARRIHFPFARMSGPVEVGAGDDFAWILDEDCGPGKITAGSAHPHGSVQAAASPEAGALSPDFELYGHPGVYVVDGCWIPTGLGVNPQLTIMAAALRSTRNLISRRRLSSTGPA